MITIEEIKEIIEIYNDDSRWYRLKELTKKLKKDISFKMILESKHPLLLGIAAYNSALYDIITLSDDELYNVLNKHRKVDNLLYLQSDNEADACRLMEYAFFAFSRLYQYRDTINSNMFDTWASAAIRMHILIVNFSEFINSFVKGYILRASQAGDFPKHIAETAVEYIKAYLINFNCFVYRFSGRSLSIHLSKEDEKRFYDVDEDARNSGPFYFREDVIKIGQDMISSINDIIKHDVEFELSPAERDTAYYATKRLALKSNSLIW